MENTIEVQEVNTDTIIQLSDGSFAVINDAIAKNNYFQLEAQKSSKELNDNLVIAIEFSGLKVSNYINAKVNVETKELVLTKKTIV